MLLTATYTGHISKFVITKLFAMSLLFDRNIRSTLINSHATHQLSRMGLRFVWFWFVSMSLYMSLRWHLLTLTELLSLRNLAVCLLLDPTTGSKWDWLNYRINKRFVTLTGLLGRAIRDAGPLGRRIYYSTQIELFIIIYRVSLGFLLWFW
jgi:hypothetical protein